MMKLFGIPHAGGSSIAYKVWEGYLDNGIEFIPLELAGHTLRSREPLSENLDVVVHDLAQSMKKSLNDNEIYAIYGHSMGGMLAYYVYFHLLNCGYEPPAHLFFSSRWP